MTRMQRAAASGAAAIETEITGGLAGSTTGQDLPGSTGVGPVVSAASSRGLPGSVGVGPAASAALMLLADGRFPTGGHAHSGGVEAAVLAGLVHDVPTLTAFLEGRLTTVGLVDAAFAAAAATPGADLVRLDGELVARTPSPAQRTASRAQSAGLVRAARAAWSAAFPPTPSPPRRPVLLAVPGAPAPGTANRTSGGAADEGGEGPGGGRVDVGGLMYPVALGAVAGAVGVGPGDAARLACHHAVMGSAGAAVRLLGLDPFAVHGVVAFLGPAITATAAEATEVAASGDAARLPAASGVVPELAADAHAVHPEALFAS